MKPNPSIFIKNKINEEIYKPDETIPPERELMEFYGVSRITVRKAVDEAVEEEVAKQVKAAITEQTEAIVKGQLAEAEKKGLKYTDDEMQSAIDTAVETGFNLIFNSIKTEGTK